MRAAEFQNKPPKGGNVQNAWLRRNEERKPPSPGAAPAPNLAPAAPAAAVAAPVPMPLAASPPPAQERKESRLIVGPDIKLKGVEIFDCDTLVVEGQVEASLDSRVIQIAEHGVFDGTVGIDVAEIRGRFTGELTARKQLILHASARVSGKIRYGTLKVEEGAQLSGDLATVGNVAKVESPTRRMA
jgi:cytoskeletal protein CcmA (bactofilin family)